MKCNKNKLKMNRRVGAGLVIIAILLFVLYSMSYRPTEGHGSSSELDLKGNGLDLKVNVPNLKKFEQELLDRFTDRFPNPSESEKSQIAKCVMNLQTNINADRKSYAGGNSEQMRVNHLSYLDKSSIVVEVGGNRGHDIGNIAKLYDPIVITLEPIEELAKSLTEKYKENRKIFVFNFGLGSATGQNFVSVSGKSGVGTSAFKLAGNTSLIIANTTEFLLRLGIQTIEIDLFLINCEGCEFEVLEAIISHGLVQKIRNIQFQAHRLSGIRNQDERYCRIEALLTRTHEPTYRYRFVWEHWRRRDLNTGRILQS